MHDVFDPTLTSLVSDDDDMSPEVAHELNRLKALGTQRSTEVDELTPKRDVHGTRSNELLGPQVGGRRPAKEFTTV